jgi:hypothetical protein
MRVVWCNPYGQCRELQPAAPRYEIRTFAELPTPSAQDEMDQLWVWAALMGIP